MAYADKWLLIVHFETNISSIAGGFTCLNNVGCVTEGNCRLLIFVHYIDIMPCHGNVFKPIVAVPLVVCLLLYGL